ncbi:hypothetical protein HMPREF0973_01819, partial [Prevotella veroralis F0319]
QEQIRTLLLQVDDVIAQDNAAKTEGVEFTAALLDEISEELNKSLESSPEPKTKEEKQAVRTKKNSLKSLRRNVINSKSMTNTLRLWGRETPTARPTLMPRLCT